MINFYLFMRFARAFLTLFAVFAAIIWIVQIFDFIDEFLEFGASMAQILELAYYPIARAMGYAVLPAFMVTVIAQLHRIIAQHEYYALAAVGVSGWTILRMLILLSVLVSIIYAVLTFYFAPHFMQSLKQYRNLFERHYTDYTITPGVFHEIRKNITIYTDAITDDGRFVRLIVHDARRADAPLTYVAQSGALIQTDDGVFFIFNNGYIQPRQLLQKQSAQNDSVPENNGIRARWVAFAQYSLPVSVTPPQGLLVQQFPPNELTLPQLLNPQKYGMTDPQKQQQIRAYKYEQSAHLISPFIFALIGFAVITAGGIRRGGYGRRIFVASALSIGYYAMLVYLAGRATTGNISGFIAFLTLPPLTVLAFSVAAFLRHETQYRPRFSRTT